MWENLITWRSKKQTIVSRSSAKSEYRALALGMWIVRLLRELKVGIADAIKVWCYNVSAIKIANNPIHHDHTKHEEINRRFIKEKIEANVIYLSYVPSRKQIANVMTKSLAREKIEGFRSKIGMINIYSPA